MCEARRWGTPKYSRPKCILGPSTQGLVTKIRETKLSFENFFSVVANKFILASRARGKTASWNIPFKF